MIRSVVTLVLLFGVQIGLIAGRPSWTIPTITSVSDGRGISTTIVRNDPVVPATVIAVPTLIASNGPISTTVIRPAEPAQNPPSIQNPENETSGENAGNQIPDGSSGDAADGSSGEENNESSSESDESSGEASNDGSDNSVESNSDEGQEATEPSVDESQAAGSAPQSAVVSAVSQVGPFSSVQIAPSAPPSAVLVAPATAQAVVVGSVPASVSSQSSTVVHSAALIPVAQPILAAQAVALQTNVIPARLLKVA